MKQIQITLFAVISMSFILLGSVTSSLLDRQLTDEEDQNPYEKLKEDLQKFFKDKLGDEFTEEGSEGSVTYTNEVKKSEVILTFETSSIDILMKNEYETQEMSLENVNFEDHQEMLENEYVNRFLNHVEQIEGDPNKIFEQFKEAISGLSYSGSFGQSSFTDVELTSGRLRERILAKKGKKPQKAGKQKNKNKSKKPKKEEVKALTFSITYQNDKLSSTSSDPVYGELDKEGEEYIIKLYSKFFEKDFILKVTTDNYIQGETKKIGKEVLRHLDSMYYLNQGPDQELLQRSLAVHSYGEHLKQTIEGSIENSSVTVPALTAEDKSATIEIKIGEEPAADITLEIPDDLPTTFVLKCKLHKNNAEEEGMAIPSLSIYSMEGILDAFVLNRLKRLEKLANGSNPEESVRVFKD
jgi:hypothetical protein